MSGYKRWTRREIALLKARYEEEGAVKLAKDLGRTKKQVGAQANILGLRVAWRTAAVLHQSGNVWEDEEKRKAAFKGVRFTDAPTAKAARFTGQPDPGHGMRASSMYGWAP